jgi:hypothetical protein
LFQNFIESYGQAANSFAGGVKYGVGYGSRYADKAKFTDAFHANRIYD